MSRWAVFDVDGTLFPPSSMEKAFLTFMLRKGVISIENIFYYFLTAILMTLKSNYEEGFKNNKYYLKYLPVPSIQTAAKKFVKQIVWPKISTLGIDRIHICRQQGYKIVLMSGSPDFLTYPLATYLQPDVTIASELEIIQNRFSGRLVNLHPYGVRKTTILKNLSQKLSLDFHKSIVFANHHSDYHHMQLFGEAVAVNPTAKLKRLAQKHGWKIERWE